MRTNAKDYGEVKKNGNTYVVSSATILMSPNKVAWCDGFIHWTKYFNTKCY